MLTKLIVLTVMFIILLALGSSLIFLVKDEGKTSRTVKALTCRIILSLGLFLFLFLSFSLGWLTPHTY